MYFSVNSYSSINSRNGVSGLMSGIDTDSVVEKMTQGTRTKIQNNLLKKQTTMWKQAAYRDVIDKASSFQKKWLSFDAGKNNISNSKFFNTKTVTSNSTYVKVSGSAASASQVQIEDIESLASTASMSTSHNLSTQQLFSGKIYENWTSSDINGKSVGVSIDGTSYSLSIGSDFKFENNADGSIPTAKQKLEAVAKELNKGIEASDKIKGKLEFSVAENGGTYKMTLTAKATTDDKGVAVPAPKIEMLTSDVKANQEFAKTLGLSADDVTSSGNTITGKGVDGKGLSTDKNLNDALSGSKLTVSFNGIAKSIVFNDDPANKGSKFGTPEKLKAYLQTEIDKAYGKGAIGVELIDTGAAKGSLMFHARASSKGSTDVFAITGSSGTDVLGANGALRISSGASTRASWSSTLSELRAGGQIDSSLEDREKYAFEINGTKIDFTKSDSLSTIINRINNSDAGVNVTYSTTSDKLTISAKDSGAHGFGSDVIIKDIDGNLGESLFGKADEQTITAGADAHLTVSFDGGKTTQEIYRSTNSFTLDGLNVELTGKANDKAVDLAGTSFILNVGGVDHTITLPSDLKIPDEFTNDEKGARLRTVVNNAIKENPALVAAGVSLEVVDGKYALQANTGSNIQLKGATSSATLMDTLGFEKKDVAGTAEAGNEQIGAKNVARLQTNVSEKITFSTETNSDELVKSITEMIKDYNEIIKSANDKFSDHKSKEDKQYKPLTDEEKKEMTDKQIEDYEARAKIGILENDHYLGTLISSMRSAMGDNVSGTSNALWKIGISTAANDWESNGILVINEEKLKAAIAKDPVGVSDLFTKTVEPDYSNCVTKEERKSAEKKAAMAGGVAGRLSYILNENCGTYGGEGLLISVAGKSGSIYGQDRLSREIRTIDSQLAKLKIRLQNEETRYFKQFSNMETYLSKIQAQSTWLTDQSSQ